MIRLKKDRTKPLVLDIHRNCKMEYGTSDLCFLYDLVPDDFNDGSENFDFDSSIYGHANLKVKLINDQNGKYAFCEQNILSVSFGDVEHYRPKGGYCQNKNDYLQRPGYY